MSAVPTGAAGLPSRSEIENWDTDDLTNAAASWRASATESENVFEQHRQNIASPGGTTWEGNAKDAALDRVTADVAVVRTQSGVLREAAAIAENGSQDIQAAQRKAQEAIAHAEADGFSVGEDLTVTDTRRVDVFTMAARHTATTEHAEDIRWNAEQLAATDALVGERLAAKAVELDGIRFDGEGDGSTVQAVSFNTMPQSPQFPLPQKPWEYNNDYTANVNVRDANGNIVSAGTLVSLDDVWNELNRCFNCNFPIGGAPKEFPKVGDEYPLEMRIAGVKAANLPVKVTEVSRTEDAIDIEFATLPGHADGDGSTIHFRWSEEAGQLHLDIRGYITEGPGSGENPFSAGARVGYTALAEVVWQPYIDRVATHVVQSKGYEALPQGVVLGGH
ncbi:WXG100 family type VII secretion target [Mycolicibacterium wolinskyi]|uniref:WXG100 family type VII secretion target n=1 Tax=Mycolicibacterium wolinskyi TaxID=59750 RepID=UPI003BAD62D6